MERHPGKGREHPEYPYHYQYPDNDSDTWPERERQRDFNEESAAEIAIPYRDESHRGERHRDESNRDESRLRELRDEAVKETRSAGRATGWTALALAFASWLVWPVLLGATAAVVGFVAYRQGARGLGVWSITLGLIAVAAYLVLIPLYYTVT